MSEHTVFAVDAKVTTKEYVKVTDGLNGPTIGIAKMSPDGMADILLFPVCPKHGKPTKVRMSMGLSFPMEIR